MTAFGTIVAALEARYPPTPDRIARLARGQRKLGKYAPLAPDAMDRYYVQWAARLVGSFLDQLNDDELELRLAHDQAAHEEFEEYKNDEGEPRRRRLVSGEALGRTVAEVARRKARREAAAP